MRKFLWLDVETTGLDPKANTVHQVAGQIVINGRTEEEFNLQMVPMATKKVEKEALAVSSLTIEEVNNRDLLSTEAYEQFNNMLCQYVDKYNKNDKFVFCAYNAGFDAGFMNEWYMDNGNQYFFGLCHGGAYIDPLQMALLAEIKAGKRLFLPNRKLATVAKALGVKLDNAHDALADIVATREVFKKLWKMVTE